MTKRRGFTLIELLVVVLIIGILAAVALPQYQVSVAKARVSEAIVNLKAITDAQEVYYMENGVYTDDLADLGINRHENGYLYTSYYYLHCFQKRACAAAPKGWEGPVLEFTLLNDKTYHGKRWCHALTDKDKRICSTLGPVDKEYGNGMYYLLN